MTRYQNGIQIIDNALVAAEVETLSATKTLTVTDYIIQQFDPNGADRDVNLPAEADSKNLIFIIINTGDIFDEDLVIKNDGSDTITTLGPGMTGTFSCDGTNWKNLNISVPELFLVSGSPATDLGNLNDIALDKDTGDFYLKEFVGTAVTWNPADKNGNITLSNGDLTATVPQVTWGGVRSTASKTSGKWYWEITVDGTDGNYHDIGIGTSAASLTLFLGYESSSWAYEPGGYLRHNLNNTAYGDTFGHNDIIGIALDMDAGKIWFSKNGVWQASGDPAAETNEAFSGITGTIFPMVTLQYSGSLTANFGGSVYSYTPPTGFLSLEQSWTEKLSPTFLKLSDTPSDYTSSNGKFVQSDGSGMVFSDVGIPELFLVSGPPATDLGNLNDIAMDTDTGDFYLKEFVGTAVTWNPADKNGNITLSNGDLTATVPQVTWRGVRSTASKTSGKWYWEITVDGIDGDYHDIGIGTSAASLTLFLGYESLSWAYDPGGYLRHNLNHTAYGDTFGHNDIIGIALDMDAGKIWFSKNGVWQASGDPAAETNEAFSGITGTIFPMVTLQYSGSLTANFGGSVYSYTPPTGFLSLESWTEKLSPTFLKLDDTPSTYTGSDGKFTRSDGLGVVFSNYIIEETDHTFKTLGGRKVNITTVNAATYSLLVTDDIVHVTYTNTGAVTITLPTAQCMAGRVITIKDAGYFAGTNHITIITEGAEKINNKDDEILNSNGNSVDVYSDGSNWHVT